MTTGLASFSWLAAVSLASFTNTAVHVIAYRALPSRGLFRALLAGFVAGCVMLSVVSIALKAPSIWSVLANATIYACFSYVYFHWNNMGETARRVRLVLELRAWPEGLSRAEIVKRYGHREMIDRRIVRLVESGQIQLIDSRYFLGKPAVLAMARIMSLLKRLLAMG